MTQVRPFRHSGIPTNAEQIFSDVLLDAYEIPTNKELQFEDYQ
jgi:hypothetical protein